MRTFKENYIGKKFSLWTVIRKSSYKMQSGNYLWICKCKCGKEKHLQIGTLINGKSKSCGCSLSHELKRKERIKQNYKVNENGCWIWQGSINQEGYGRIDNLLVHRFSYKIFKGEIPKGMCVCHNCPGGDNRACINPEHLWLGTSQENMKDKVPKGRQLRGQKIGTSKLTDKKVIEIKKRYKNGETGVHLAKEYNVSHGLIYHILNGRAWKHIHISG